MNNKNFDIYGLGSALIDILVEVEEETLENLNLKKGEMTFVDRNQCDIIEHELEKHQTKKVPGGSTANAIVVASQLGSKTIFCDVVGKDLNGGIYRESMEKEGVKTNLAVTDNITGHASTFITPDSQRTFAVHLGAALDLDKAHINIEDLKSCKILHTESYLLGAPGRLKEACIHAMEIAKKNNVLVSLDLSDPNIVRSNKEDIKEIVKNYVDIVFANEDEAKELTGFEYEEALHEISKSCKITIVKLGENGSLIKKDNGVMKVEPHKTNAVDTTGAGDTYAAAILHGLANNIPLEKAGKLGSFLAAKVISQIGARLENIDKEEVYNILQNE